MMDINDVKKLIDNVTQRPFFCSDTEITTDNGYVITTKERYERLCKHRLCRKRKNGYISPMDRIGNSC